MAVIINSFLSMFDVINGFNREVLSIGITAILLADRISRYLDKLSEQR
ncbi:MAG: hypothetical protein J6568_08140 [Snodgrassella sp.]|nr:hypothetical protein [Snodgrassella sp.]